jgi:hypothetical protein
MMHMMNRTVALLLLLVFICGAVPAMSGCDVMKDKRLQAKIREELGKHRDVQVSKLTINARDGIVTISGELYTMEEIDQVVEIVSGIEGVEQVHNLMTLPDDFQTHNPTFLYY